MRRFSQTGKGANDLHLGVVEVVEFVEVEILQRSDGHVRAPNG
jgi:hypothetical protein